MTHRTYCLKHYRRTFPDKGCDICALEATVEELKAKLRRSVATNVQQNDENLAVMNTITSYPAFRDWVLGLGHDWEVVFDAHWWRGILFDKWVEHVCGDDPGVRSILSRIAFKPSILPSRMLMVYQADNLGYMSNPTEARRIFNLIKAWDDKRLLTLYRNDGEKNETLDHALSLCDNYEAMRKWASGFGPDWDKVYTAYCWDDSLTEQWVRYAVGDVFDYKKVMDYLGENAANLSKYMFMVYQADNMCYMRTAQKAEALFTLMDAWREGTAT